jgi:propionyl-CoA carboxylase alpha chain
VLAALPPGWRNLPSATQRTSYLHGEQEVDVGYALRRDGVVVEVNGTALRGVRIWSTTADQVDLEVDGVRRRYAVSRLGATTWVDSALGATTLVEQERYPEPGSGLVEGALTAPMPGTVVRVDVAPGDRVVAGQALVVLEAMKMEHAVRATGAGQVAEIGVRAGQQVDAGALLVVVEPA